MVIVDLDISNKFDHVAISFLWSNQVDYCKKNGPIGMIFGASENAEGSSS